MTIKPFKERFWGQVEKTKSCWNWIGKVAGAGYGSIKRLKTSGAHRVSYEIHKGKIPKGYYVLHKCDNKICVNPDHLWIGTQSDNMKDCQKKGRNPNAYRWSKGNHPFIGIPRTQAQKDFTASYKQRPFTCVNPQGKKITGINLRKFCKANNLNQGAMWSVIHGKIKRHKKWTQFIQ